MILANMQLWSQRQGVGAGGGPAGPYNIEMLIVAGGGGGGGHVGGGGGAGGYRTSTEEEVDPSNQLTITIGAGGAGGIYGNSGDPPGSNGVASSITGSVITNHTHQRREKMVALAAVEDTNRRFNQALVQVLLDKVIRVVLPVQLAITAVVAAVLGLMERMVIFLRPAVEVV